MNLVFDDGGRRAAGFRGRAGDCVARAVAIVSGRPYREVYETINNGCRTQRRTSKGKYGARSRVDVRRKWFRDYMSSLGFSWTPCMGIGTGCRVHLHDGELPAGRLVVSVSKHYTAVIDGVIHDTHDPQRTTGRCVYGYWKLDN